MKHFEYKTKGVCSQMITFDIDEDVVRNIQFFGGCNGNLKGISSLVEGMKIEDIQSKLKGIPCGNRVTSCPDQLAIAVKLAAESLKEC
ncbi:MAG: TIGR03905 family TSCPD domain-containing protein [Oscillospiraceae bacterium]|jgi:uncharacterized protein (TIGR03905 family)|nr:TIGR03905 family TSCPD domain-containing protein [Oscillospiraceae bacterium]